MKFSTGCESVGALLESATMEVVVMSSLPNGGRDAIMSFCHTNLRRGVRYRIVVPDKARVTPGPSAQLSALSLAGATVRTVPEVPADGLVIDGTAALVPTGRPGTAGVAVFRLPSVVTTVWELFERIWPGAVPFLATDLPETAELTLRQREVLTLLWEGHTDESAAARLQVSVRTIRRTVSDIMNRLGARSRFQAGAKAADRGWLLEKAS
jgi:DNA-binding CsgD family transcriptional regulator